MSWEKVGNIMGPAGPQGPPGPAGSGGGAANFICGETPVGLIDGINRVYTASATFVSGTLEVYLNGLRQREVDDYDEISTTQFQFVTAPKTGDSISIDYLKSGTVNAVYGETPSGALNGVNKNFTTAAPYSPLLLAVYLSGLRLRRTDDYVELSSTTFQMVNPPLSTDSISVDYFQP
jgi:hypothetical protein